VAWWAAASNNQSTCGLNGGTKTETRSKRQFEKIILGIASLRWRGKKMENAGAALPGKLGVKKVSDEEDAATQQ